MTKKRKKIIVIAAIIAVAIAIACAGTSVLRIMYIKTVGINLKPSQDFEIHEMRFFLQNDPEWSGDKIGETSRTIGSVGCLVSCVASVINDFGVSVTPGELNEKLTEVQGYIGADLIWYKIHEAIPEADYSYKRTFSGKTIENDLSNGLFPIVNVKYKNGGVTHWVVIVGAQNGDFMVYDPLDSSRTPMPLSVHGRVNAYRVVYLSEAG